MNKKRLLIAGGSYADIPLIVAAKMMGYHVITCSYRPDDLGHKYSDEHYLVDYSDLNAVLNLAERLKIDAICPCCNDASALTSAYVAERLNLKGHDSYEISRILHHKDLFRDICLKNNIPVPYGESFSDTKKALKALQKFNMPVIIKPVDRTGGKGVSRIDSIEEGEKAIEKAFALSNTKRIIIEEFIEGKHFGLSTFIVDKKVAFHFSGDEYYYKNPYLVSAASTPASCDPKIIESICLHIEKLARTLSFTDGIFHIQFILKENKPYITDVCRRGPGDLYIRFVEIATGVSYAKWIVQAFTGTRGNEIYQKEPEGFFTRHCIMGDRNGKLKELVIDKSIKNNILEEFIWATHGYEVNDYLTTKFGIVFLKFDSMNEMLNKTRNMQELIKAVIL